MKVVFVPFSLLLGLAAGQVAKKAFAFAWGKVADEEAPASEHRDISIPALIAALALEGAIFRVTKGLVDNGSRRGWARLTGTWPGDEDPDPA